MIERKKTGREVVELEVLISVVCLVLAHIYIRYPS